MKICMIDAGVFVEKPELLDPLKEMGEVSVFTGVPESVDEVVSRAGDAEIVIFALMQITNEMLDRLPNLKILQFMGTGVSNFVDVEYAESKGIKVLNITGYGSNAVAEFGVAMALTLARNILPGNKIVLSGSWNQDGLMGKEIAGSTVGVAGTGSIGRLVAEKFIGLGANVIACDIFESDYLKEKYGVEYVSMEELFKRSDIVSLHMLVTPENTRMIDKSYFDSMKDGALLVNVARSELVNTDDLYDALTSGKLAGAAIDVYDHEPPADMDLKLAALSNVVATPHIGFYSEQANDNSITYSIESIKKELQ